MLLSPKPVGALALRSVQRWRHGGDLHGVKSRLSALVGVCDKPLALHPCIPPMKQLRYRLPERSGGHSSGAVAHLLEQPLGVSQGGFLVAAGGWLFFPG